MNDAAGIVSCGFSAPIIGSGTDESVGTESVSWGIATKLGASETHDSTTAHNLCYHRWRWFAGAPREERGRFEAMVQERLYQHLWEYWERTGIAPVTEDTPYMKRPTSSSMQGIRCMTRCGTTAGASPS